MGIRGRLLALVKGTAVPLALLGVLDLRRGRQARPRHLDEALRQQAELAAVAFERWIDARQQPLVTAATALGAEPGARQADVGRSLRVILASRPYWVDVRGRGLDAPLARAWRITPGARSPGWGCAGC